jgi:hypothetical protein
MLSCDENFIVNSGDRPLAEAYAVNAESAWRHYAYRAGNPHPNLQRHEEPFWHL